VVGLDVGDAAGKGSGACNKEPVERICENETSLRLSRHDCDRDDILSGDLLVEKRSKSVQGHTTGKKEGSLTLTCIYFRGCAAVLTVLSHNWAGTSVTLCWGEYDEHGDTSCRMPDFAFEADRTT